MLFTENNLKNIKVSKYGNFRHILYGRYYYHYACEECGYPFIDKRVNGKYCSRICSNIGKNNPMFGRKRINHAIKMSGRGNPNWKGGITNNPYCPLWSDKEYKNWIKHERDNGKCQNPQCNGNSAKLCLHHINYDKTDCRPSNLITLCNSCNVRANYNRDWHRIWYQELVSS